MFRLSIVTPEKVFLETEVKSLMVPGTEGYLGVLPHHAPLITALKPGKVEFRDSADKVHVMAVSSGFLEVSRNHANLLVQAAEYAEDIDFERAQTAYEKAQADLNAAVKAGIEQDIAAQTAALERAVNRVKIYKETH